ncbi:MAG: branched-chain amino acid ABC transporter permease [Burkholderiaceae bacterium]|nr:branched-chain amino acid ABC transporter permease [Burkholderiaceae bacterium]
MTVRRPLRYWLTDPAVVMGFRDMVPATIAMVAWGMVTGVAMVQSGLSTWQALGMTLMVYAGSAQLTSLPLFAAAAPLPIIWASALIVNLRFVLYGVAVRPFFRQFSWPRRLLYGFGNVDVLTGDFLRRFDPARLDQPALLTEDTGGFLQRAIAYFEAAALTIWSVWTASSIAGILLAQWIPASWGLDFVGTLALIALLMPMMTSRAEFICVVVAGITAVLCAWMPLKLGILVAMIAGVAAAMMKPLSAEEQDSE